LIKFEIESLESIEVLNYYGLLKVKNYFCN